MDLAALLLEMEMASTLAESSGGQTSSSATPASREQLSADRQRAADTLRLRINEMLNPGGGLQESGAFDFQPANLFAPPSSGEGLTEGTTPSSSSRSLGTTPLPSPQRGTRRSVGERNSSRGASRASSGSRRNRGERHSFSEGGFVSANSSPMTHVSKLSIYMSFDN